MKPNLILLHGALGASNQLSPLASILEEQYTIHNVQFSGHGGSEYSSEGFRIPVFAKELETYLDNNEIKNALVFGYSMGGYVALKLAARRPEFISSIVTLATKFDWTLETVNRELKMLNPSIIEEKVPKFAAALEKRNAPNDWKEHMEKTGQLMADLATGNKLNEQELSAINCSVKLLIGDADHMVSIDETRHIAAQISGATLAILEGVKHPIEQVNLNQVLNHLHTHA